MYRIKSVSLTPYAYIVRYYSRRKFDIVVEVALLLSPRLRPYYLRGWGGRVVVVALILCKQAVWYYARDWGSIRFADAEIAPTRGRDRGEVVPKRWDGFLMTMGHFSQRVGRRAEATNPRKYSGYYYICNTFSVVLSMSYKSVKEVIDLLLSHGFVLKSQRGSHMKFVKDGYTVVVPNHGKKGIEKGTYHNILRTAGIK